MKRLRDINRKFDDNLELHKKYAQLFYLFNRVLKQEKHTAHKTNIHDSKTLDLVLRNAVSNVGTEINLLLAASAFNIKSGWISTFMLFLYRVYFTYVKESETVNKCTREAQSMYNCYIPI